MATIDPPTPRSSALAWLADSGPRNEEEATDVARALMLRRERFADMERLEGLTPFERALADRAAHAAAQSVVRAIEAVIGRAAETVSAGALREALAHTGPGLDFKPAGRSFGVMTPGRVRAAGLVADAAREAEHERNRSPASGGDGA